MYKWVLAQPFDKSCNISGLVSIEASNLGIYIFSTSHISWLRRILNRDYFF